MAISFDHDHLVHIRPNGPMLITGPKGSGKTSIGVKKAAYLLENYCSEVNDRILLVNNSKSLYEHSTNLMNRIKQEKVQTLMDLFDSGQGKLDISSIDGLMYRYYKSYCEDNNFMAEIFDEEEYYHEILYEGIEILKSKYPDVIYLDKKYRKFLLAEIDWIRACGYLEEQQYQNAERMGLKELEREGPSKLNKNSKSRKAIYDLMVYFSDCCKENGKIDFIEANILALMSVQNDNCDYYSHIIIDDCNEFSKIQLDLIINLYKPKAYSSITFLFDDHMHNHSRSWLGNGRPFTTVGFDMTGRSKTLDIQVNCIAGKGSHLSSRNNDDVNITYREIPEMGKLAAYILDLIKENISYEDFSIVVNNEATEVELKRCQNLLKITRKKSGENRRDKVMTFN